MAATDAPPSYEEAIARLQKEMTPEKREALVVQLVADAEKPELNEKLVKEVGELANTAGELKDLFMGILVDLSKFEYTGTNLKDVWRGYYEEFNALVNQSVGTASQTLSNLDEFVDLVIPVIKAITGPEDNAGREQAIKVLNNFINKVSGGKDKIGVEDAEKLLKEYAKSLEQFRVKIASFVPMFIEFAKKHSSEIAEEVKQLTEKLATLNSQLAELEAEATKWAVILGITAIVGGYGAAFAMLALTPLGGLAILITYIIVLGVEVGFLLNATGRIEDKIAEINGVKKRLADLEGEKNLISAVRSRLEKSDGDINTMIKKLGNFGVVWVGIATDAHRFKEALDTLSTTDPKDFTTFRIGVERAESLYKPLRNGLVAYVKNASASGFV